MVFFWESGRNLTFPDIRWDIWPELYTVLLYISFPMQVLNECWCWICFRIIAVCKFIITFCIATRHALRLASVVVKVTVWPVDVHDTCTPSWLLLLLVKLRDTSAMLRLLLRSYSSCSMVSRITRRITVNCIYIRTQLTSSIHSSSIKHQLDWQSD